MSARLHPRKSRLLRRLTKAAQRVNDAVEAHLADYIEQFEDYAPDQVPKLRDPILRR